MVWTVAYNRTHRRWMIWRDGSPAIAECVVEKDAELIANLLNLARVELHSGEKS